MTIRSTVRLRAPFLAGTGLRMTYPDPRIRDRPVRIRAAASQPTVELFCGRTVALSFAARRLHLLPPRGAC